MKLDHRNWKQNVQKFLFDVQGELKKTTSIGKKMIHASRANTDLRESYEELGKLAAREIMANRLDWDHPQAKEILRNIQSFESEMMNFEEDVKNIKHPENNSRKE